LASTLANTLSPRSLAPTSGPPDTKARRRSEPLTSDRATTVPVADALAETIVGKPVSR